MATAFITHPLCLQHDPGPGHPEGRARLEAVLAAAAALPLVSISAPPATREQILRAHTSQLLEAVEEAAPLRGYMGLDPDTVMSPATLEAAYRAAGAGIAAVDALAAGTARNAFCAVRPPGHHAEPDRAMGFCFFNNIAIAAHHARSVHGWQRVAVVDFDVHHGNGTQVIAASDPDFFFASSHQWPFYPGSGSAHDAGAYNNVLNVPLAAGSSSAAFRAAWQSEIIPALSAFGPKIILVSAGYDGHEHDPLGGLGLTTADYGWLTAELAAAANQLCDGRLILMLEGGYNPAALAAATTASLQALLVA